MKCLPIFFALHYIRSLHLFLRPLPAPFFASVLFGPLAGKSSAVQAPTI